MYGQLSGARTSTATFRNALTPCFWAMSQVSRYARDSAATYAAVRVKTQLPATVGNSDPVHRRRSLSSGCLDQAFTPSGIQPGQAHS